MALTYVDINAFTQNFLVKKTTEVVFKNDPLLTKIIANKNVFPGGNQIQRPIQHAKLTGGAFTKGDTFDTAYRVTDTAFVVNPKFYYINVSLYGLDDVINRGPHAAFSIVQSKMENASLAMAENLAKALYSDGQGSATSTKEIDGLMAWIDDGSTNATYSGGTTYVKSFAAVGGITRSDILAGPSTGSATAYSQVGGINSFCERAQSTFTLDDLNKAYGFAWFGPEMPDTLICTQGAYDKIWKLTTPLQRYTPTDTVLGKVGFQSFRFNAADVVISKYFQDTVTGYGSGTTLGAILGLNSKYLEMYVTDNKKYMFGFTGFKEAQNTVDVCGQFLFAGNMIYANPRTAFKLVGTALVQ